MLLRLARCLGYNSLVIDQDPALEMRRGGNSTVGSNPTLSAIFFIEIHNLLPQQYFSVPNEPC